MGIKSFLTGGGGNDAAEAREAVRHQQSERHIATSGDNDAIERRALRAGLDGYDENGEWRGF